MNSVSRRLVALAWALVGAALIAPIAGFYAYRNTHADAELGIFALGFLALIAFFGLQILLRALWTALRGRA